MLILRVCLRANPSARQSQSCQGVGQSSLACVNQSRLTAAVAVTSGVLVVVLGFEVMSEFVIVAVTVHPSGLKLKEG